MNYATEERIVNGSKIVFLKCGSGAPLIYLHGFIDEGELLPVLDKLSNQYTVYYPQHPGYSRSDENATIESMQDMAFYYLDWMAAMGLDKVTIMGSSLGGWLALEMAVISPDKIAKLILIDSLGIRVEGVNLPDIFMMNPQKLAEHLYVGEQFKHDVVELMSSDSKFENLVIKNRIATARLAWNPYFHNPKLLDRIHRVSMPVLIVWGKEDRLFPVAYGEGYRKLIPQAEFRVMENSGHLPHVEQPDQFLTTIADFLN